MGEYFSKLITLYKSNVSKPGLVRVVEMLKRLGNPQNEIKCIHVAGTNGKGSTSAYIDSVMRAAGYKSALFTSPHIYDIREYMKIDNKIISEEKIEEYAKTAFEICDKMIEDGFEHPTFFEMMTAIAFDYFSDSDCDIAVIETGMGGKNDATNVIYPILSVITHISLDHMDYLGDTVAKIAKVKSGIIKQDIPVVIAPNQESASKAIIKSKCKKTNSEFIDVSKNKIEIYEMELDYMSFKTYFEKEEYRFKLKNVGMHQAENAITALCAVKTLSMGEFDIDYSAIKKGINSTKMDSRIQIIEDKKIVMDVSHNQEGVRELGAALNELLPDTKKILICSMLNTKDAVSIAAEYSEFIDYAYLIKFDHPMAADINELMSIFREHKIECVKYDDMDELMKEAMKKSKEEEAYIVVSGTFHIISDVKEAIKDI